MIGCKAEYGVCSERDLITMRAISIERAWKIYRADMWYLLYADGNYYLKLDIKKSGNSSAL